MYFTTGRNRLVSKRKLDVSKEAIWGFSELHGTKMVWIWPTFMVLVFSVDSCFHCTNCSCWLVLGCFRCWTEKPGVILLQSLLLRPDQKAEHHRTEFSMTEAILSLRTETCEAAGLMKFWDRLQSEKGIKTQEYAGCSPDSIIKLLYKYLSPRSSIWNGVNNKIYNKLNQKDVFTNNGHNRYFCSFPSTIFLTLYVFFPNVYGFQ